MLGFDFFFPFDRFDAFFEYLRSDGIKIAVPLDTPILAAADGVVAYVGSDVPALGGLVILKHGDGMTTVYGYAGQLVVQRGQSVKKGQMIALSGNSGFAAGDRADGPVVNPSYWVFEALPAMAELAPKGPWNELAANGKVLLAGAMKVGPSDLPPDWVSLKAKPEPADGFPQEFSYNAVRIPLYLVRAGINDRDLLTPLMAGMTDEQGRVRIVDVATGP